MIHFAVRRAEEKSWPNNHCLIDETLRGLGGEWDPLVNTLLLQTNFHVASYPPVSPVCSASLGRMHLFCKNKTGKSDWKVRLHMEPPWPFYSVSVGRSVRVKLWAITVPLNRLVRSFTFLSQRFAGRVVRPACRLLVPELKVALFEQASKVLSVSFFIT